MSIRATVLMYHYVRDDDSGAGGAPIAVGATRVHPAAFEAQLDALARSRPIVAWPAFAAALSGGPALAPGSCMLTFDDGLEDHHRVVLPRLAARGLPATFFVMARASGERLSVGHRLHVLLAVLQPAELRAAVVDRMSEDQCTALLAAEGRRAAASMDDPLEDLKWVLQRDVAVDAGPILSALVEQLIGTEGDVADQLHLGEQQLAELVEEGMTLGGHGQRHLWFDWVARSSARAEVQASRRLLERYGPPDGWPFAYPYGGVPARPASLFRPAGFAAAFLARQAARSDRFHLGRVDAESADPWAALIDTRDCKPEPMEALDHD